MQISKDLEDCIKAILNEIPILKENLIISMAGKKLASRRARVSMYRVEKLFVEYRKKSMQEIQKGKS